MHAVCDSLYKKTGGFIQGICHPDNNYALLRGAGLKWVRRDLPYPFDTDGNITDSYKDFKKACEKYADEGISQITVTPYPNAFIERGIDVRTPEGLEKASAVCEFIAKDYMDIKTCWQITNEMHITHFRAPLTSGEAKDFIIACANGVMKGNPDAAVGHNSVDEGWQRLCIEIEKQTGGKLDYIGFDCYDGTWGPGGPDTYIKKINSLYESLKKPVILMEFGFASRGEFMDIGGGEVDRYLHSLGFKDIGDVKARQDDFINALPPYAARTVGRCAPEDRLPCLMGLFPHILKKWPFKGDIPHTEEGQAEFYAELLPKLMDSPYLGGAVIYCWKDAEKCFSCEESDCPCETAWGLLRLDGSAKPAYEAVKKVFTSDI